MGPAYGKHFCKSQVYSGKSSEPLFVKYIHFKLSLEAKHIISINELIT